MKKYLSLCLLISMTFILYSFSEKENYQLFSAYLKIEVLDELGNSQKGAKVMLYLSEKDYLEKKHQVGEVYTSDEKGKVFIKGLKERPYYLRVVKGDKDNHGGAVKTAKLKNAKVTHVTVVVTE